MMQRTPPVYKRPRLPSPSSALHGDNVVVEAEEVEGRGDGPLSSSHPQQQIVLRHSQQEITFADHLDCDDLDGDAHESFRCTYKCKQMVKSEVLENLEEQEKKIAELSSQVEDLQSSATSADVEKKGLVERVKRLEQEEAAASARERAIEEKYIREMERAEEMYRAQFKRCEDLEVKLQQEMRHRSEAEMKLDAVSNQIVSLEYESNKTKEESKKRIVWLEECISKLQKDIQRDASKANIEISAEKSRIQIAEAEVQAIQSQCDNLQQRLSECLEENCELSRKLAATTCQVTSPHGQDVQLVIKTLRDELKSFEADVAEARKVKQFHTNVSLLKEKLESERLRAERAEAALEELADREIQVESLKRELQSWKCLLDEIPDVERLDDIPRKFAALRREALFATAKIAELTVQLEFASGKENRGGQENANLSRDGANDLELQNQRLKRKVELLTKERDGLKAILASYDEEDAILTSQNKMDIGMLTPGKAKEKRIQELEALVEDLQREGDVLRIDLAKAETKLGRGDYDPLTTRVVHMVENLDLNAEKQALLAEIQGLREKVKSLEDNRLNEGMESTKNTELSLLREQVNSLEKREARYKKVFAEKISLFRQACCLLFGYMVEMSEEQQVSTGMTVTLFTLQSIYAQNEDETMEFQLESNRMNLRANKYASSPEISRMVDVYCRKFKSIPAFTANLTSELFNKSTCN